MQFAKDSFYITLRDRLAAANPARTVTIDGVVQPAIVLADKGVTAAELLPDCFYLSFGAVGPAKLLATYPARLLAIECTIAYGTRGAAVDGSDRERALTALDGELLQICAPPATAKIDYTQTPPQSLGTNMFWQQPRLGEVVDESMLRRSATLALFFLSEVNA